MFRDYTNYDVLEDGKIWSKVSKKFLKPYKNKNGYLYVDLYDNEGKRHTERLHKVIYCAVNGLWNLPEGYELHHLNEEKTSNQIGNLLLCSHQDNCNHGTRNERMAKALGKRVGAFKNDELIMAFPSTMEAERNGYCHTAVAACCKNCYIREGNNKYKGYEWRYLDN